MVHAALLLLLLLCYRLGLWMLVMHGCERLLVLHLYGCTDLVGGTLGTFGTSAFARSGREAGWLASVIDGCKASVVRCSDGG
jgi:hypothetical protein